MDQQTSGPKRVQTEKIAYEDVDDVIGLAARLKEADEERLTVEELEEVARELEIEPEYVARAVDALRRRRLEQAERSQATQARRRKLVVGVAAVVAGLCGVVVATGLVGRGGLSERLSTSKQKRAQVVNVVERRARVEARLKGLPQTPDREAELIGSENRVRIETKRYDEAAARYNTYASSIPGLVAVALFRMDARLPLSNEVKAW